LLSTLCLSHHFALGGGIETVSASARTEVDLDPSCPLLRPIDPDHNEAVEVKFWTSDSFPIPWAENSTVLSGPIQLDMAPSDIFDEEKSNDFWAEIMEPTVGFVFVSDNELKWRNWTEHVVTESLRKALREKANPALEGFFIVTPSKILTVQDCQDGIAGHSSFDRLELKSILHSCGFQYNGCFCDKSGSPHSKSGRGCRSLDECKGTTIAFKENYQCEKCALGYMGDHCEKSVFLFGIISITIISLTSLAGAVLAPLRSWKYYPDLQSGMIALAVGCLSGDAVLHLIPIIFGLHNHDHGAHEDHDHHAHHDHHDHEGHDEHEEHSDALAQNALVTQRGMMLLMGLYIFYLFETSIGLIQHYRTHKRQTKNRQPSSSSQHKSRHVSESCVSTLGHKLSVIDTDFEANRPCFEENCSLEDDVIDDDVIENGRDASMVLVNGNDDKITEKLIKGNGTTKIAFEPETNHGHGHSHGHSHVHGDIAMVGWMVIFGDGLHNFADGLAIGAAFSASYSTGLGTVFAVFFHELPHEIGDFAVLLGSGMAVKQAMFWNLISSFTCFIGFFGGVILADSKEMQIWILGIAAGAFIYIALVDMLPEIRINSIHQIQSTARRFFVHQVGLLTGVLIMWLMATYEEKLHHYFE